MNPTFVYASTSRNKMGWIEIDGKSHNIYEGVNTIGRDLKATVKLRDAKYSKQHALITVINDQEHYISDFSSSNGTYMNNKTLVPYLLYKLNDSEEIMLSDSVGKYHKTNQSSDNESTVILEENQTQTQITDNIAECCTQILYDKNSAEKMTYTPEIIVKVNENNDNTVDKELKNKTSNESNIQAGNIVNVHEAETQIICCENKDNANNCNPLITAEISEASPGYFHEEQEINDSVLEFTQKLKDSFLEATIDETVINDDTGAKPDFVEIEADVQSGVDDYEDDILKDFKDSDELDLKHKPKRSRVLSIEGSEDSDSGMEAIDKRINKMINLDCNDVETDCDTDVECSELVVNKRKVLNGTKPAIDSEDTDAEDNPHIAEIQSEKCSIKVETPNDINNENQARSGQRSPHEELDDEDVIPATQPLETGSAKDVFCVPSQPPGDPDSAGRVTDDMISMPAQPLLLANKSDISMKNEDMYDEDDFIVPTQALTLKTHSGPTALGTVEGPGARQSEAAGDTEDDAIFLMPTQLYHKPAAAVSARADKQLSISKGSEVDKPGSPDANPQQTDEPSAGGQSSSIGGETHSTSSVANVAGGDDDDIFLMPTQKLVSSSKHAEVCSVPAERVQVDNGSLDNGEVGEAGNDDIFLLETQKWELGTNDRKQQSSPNLHELDLVDKGTSVSAKEVPKQSDDRGAGSSRAGLAGHQDDIFEVATQKLVVQKVRDAKESSEHGQSRKKDAEMSDTSLKLFLSEPEDGTSELEVSLERDGQRAQPPSADTTAAINLQEPETQLEVVFDLETQRLYVESETNRPNNPLANTFSGQDICSTDTQDEGQDNLNGDLLGDSETQPVDIVGKEISTAVSSTLHGEQATKKLIRRTRNVTVEHDDGLPGKNWSKEKLPITNVPVKRTRQTVNNTVEKSTEESLSGDTGDDDFEPKNKKVLKSSRLRSKSNVSYSSKRKNTPQLRRRSVKPDNQVDKNNGDYKIENVPSPDGGVKANSSNPFTVRKVKLISSDDDTKLERTVEDGANLGKSKPSSKGGIKTRTKTNSSQSDGGAECAQSESTSKQNVRNKSGGSAALGSLEQARTEPKGRNSSSEDVTETTLDRVHYDKTRSSRKHKLVAALISETLDSNSNDSQDSIRPKRIRRLPKRLESSDDETPNPAEVSKPVVPRRARKTAESLNVTKMNVTVGLAEIRPCKVVFTMLNDEHLEKAIQALGGEIIDSVYDCTVLVSSKISRSLKFLLAIIMGKPIVGAKWIKDCQRHKKFLDPWVYVLEDEPTESKYSFKLKDSLQRAKSTKLLEGYSILPAVTKNFDVIKEIVELSGAKCVTRSPAKSVQTKFVVVSYETDSAKHSKYLKQKNVMVVNAEAVFSGILKQKLEWNKHLL